MKDIKKYSSSFATKLMYLISLNDDNDSKSLVDQVCDYIDEKDTTVRNWLFNGKIPRLPKRVSIADAIGVSVDYLFSDSVLVKSIEKPKIYKEEGRYLVPFMQEENIFNVKKNDLMPINSRIPIMLPNFDKLILNYGEGIYATQIKESNFQPYVENGSIILFTDNIKLEEYRFVLLRVKNKLFLKRLIKSGKTFQLMHYSLSGDEIIEPITKTDELLLMIIAFNV